MCSGKQQMSDSSLLPVVTWRNAGSRCERPSDAHHHPPSHAGHRHYPLAPSMPQLSVSLQWCRSSALYACYVAYERDLPGDVEYYGLPFFRLFLDDIYDDLEEAGHPSQHKDLPLVVDAGADCLLLTRDMPCLLTMSPAQYKPQKSLATCRSPCTQAV